MVYSDLLVILLQVLKLVLFNRGLLVMMKVGFSLHLYGVVIAYTFQEL